MGSTPGGADYWICLVRIVGDESEYHSPSAIAWHLMPCRNRRGTGPELLLLKVMLVKQSVDLSFLCLYQEENPR